MSPEYSALGCNGLKVSLDGSVLILTIDRAEHFNKSLVHALVEVFDLADRDDRVRVVILTADPTAPAFCSGADISGGWDGLWDPEAEKEGEHAHRDSGGQVALAVLNCRKITIVAVNGHAAGVGVTGLQLPFDFRFIWAGAKITFPFVRRGITPEATSTFLLPRLVGHAAATALLLTGATFSPSDKPISPLYYSILDTREEVFPAALAFAKELASSTSQVSVAYTKSLLLHPGNTAEENHLLDSWALRRVAKGKGTDAEEGVRAFRKRRLPVFRDRLTEEGRWMPWWRTWDVRHRWAKL